MLSRPNSNTWLMVTWRPSWTKVSFSGEQGKGLHHPAIKLQIWYQTIGIRIMSVYIYNNVYIYICIYIHTYIDTYIHTCMHACIHTNIHTYVCIYVYTCIYIYVYMYIHMYMYIHTFNQPRGFPRLAQPQWRSRRTTGENHPVGSHRH